MKKKGEQLDVVVKLALDAERKAAEALSAAQERVAEATEQLTTVQSYMREYQEKARVALAGHARQLQAERAFVVELERMAQLQESQVDQLQQALELARARWLSSRMKRQAVEDVLARRVQTREQRRERVEQQHLDDQPRRSGWS